MSGRALSAVHPEVVLHRRNISRVTDVPLLHDREKADRIAALPRRGRRAQQAGLEAEWAAAEHQAKAQAGELLAAVRSSVEDLSDALTDLARTNVPELTSRLDGARHHLRSGQAHLQAAVDALARGGFADAGAAVEEAGRELGHIGGPLIVALNRALAQAAASKAQRAELAVVLSRWEAAKTAYESSRGSASTALLASAATLRHADAEVYRQAAKVLTGRPRATGPVVASGQGDKVRVIPPHECETLADVGGLDEVKARLRETIGAILERPDDAARYHVVHNGVLFYGPPGTGKNLLSRALAGEYGLRYLRFSPASIASVYQHETATNLRGLFELAKANAPCLLYLDEIDTIAGDRGDQPSAEHREVVTQLMVCLEEYRSVPGLVIAAGTNDLDRLDPALREGRFDTKLLVPLPDPDARADILRVHLRRRADAVDWDGLELADIARLAHGYTAAAIESVVSAAAQAALRSGGLITHELLVDAVRERGGRHRITLEHRIGWDDVVLASDTRSQLQEVVTVFSRPDLARQVGVSAPAGILLYGPPGTGKTTIARAVASQVEASFYEVSAAELLSKWAGESEQRVAKLFRQAQANRPSVIFIDEIDALMRRRTADTSAKWEERVLSQFLAELDGLRSDEGVLLVGATNRLDVIDDAVVARRLVPIEVGLPDAAGRLQLLKLLCRDAKLADDVNLRAVALGADGVSGADLKRLRDRAGMRALTRAASEPDGETAVAITQADFDAALALDRSQTSLLSV